MQGQLTSQLALQLGRFPQLLLTNQYPSYEHIYRNGFVHRRVLGYRQEGMHVDVFCLRKAGAASYHEYEDVDVTVGWQEQLRAQLSSNPYQTVLVHFLDDAMWAVLREVIDYTRVIVCVEPERPLGSRTAWRWSTLQQERNFNDAAHAYRFSALDHGIPAPAPHRIERGVIKPRKSARAAYGDGLDRTVKGEGEHEKDGALLPLAPTLQRIAGRLSRNHLCAKITILDEAGRRGRRYAGDGRNGKACRRGR